MSKQNPFKWCCQTNPNYSPKVPNTMTTMRRFSAKNLVIFERLFGLYCKAQKAFYRMYHSAMAAHVEEVPSWKKYRKTNPTPEMAKAA